MVTLIPHGSLTLEIRSSLTSSPKLQVRVAKLTAVNYMTSSPYKSMAVNHVVVEVLFSSLFMVACVPEITGT